MAATRRTAASALSAYRRSAAGWRQRRFDALALRMWNGFGDEANEHERSAHRPVGREPVELSAEGHANRARLVFAGNDMNVACGHRNEDRERDCGDCEDKAHQQKPARGRRTEHTRRATLEHLQDATPSIVKRNESLARPVISAQGQVRLQELHYGSKNLVTSASSRVRRIGGRLCQIRLP